MTNLKERLEELFQLEHEIGDRALLYSQIVDGNTMYLNVGEVDIPDKDRIIVTLYDDGNSFSDCNCYQEPDKIYIHLKVDDLCVSDSKWLDHLHILKQKKEESEYNRKWFNLQSAQRELGLPITKKRISEDHE